MRVSRSRNIASDPVSHPLGSRNGVVGKFDAPKIN